MTEFTQSELTAIRMTVRDLVGYDEADAVSFRIVLALSSWHDAPTERSICDCIEDTARDCGGERLAEVAQLYHGYLQMYG